MKISLVNEMRNMDRRAMEEFKIPQEILMENAGQAAYFTILKEVGVKNKKFIVFCGVGNNGGDGLVVARKIHSSGGQVSVFILGDSSKFKGAAKLNFDMTRALQIKMLELRDVATAMEELKTADAIIDAVFGTGLDREITGVYRDAIDRMNSSGKTIISIDIPSGVHGDTGQVLGTAVKANYTTTFGLPKTGNLLYPGFALGGKLYLSHISFPPLLQNSDQLKTATNDPLPVPERAKDTHKGACGKALFIAGSSSYLGAPYFASLSFLKAGGGLSFLAAPGNVASSIGNKGSEIVLVPQKSTDSGSLALENKQRLLKFAEKVDMVVLGPGLSLNDETQTLIRLLSAEIDKPLLIDGDGITAVAQDLKCLQGRSVPTILTPHAGEMARLSKLSVEDIAKDKIRALQKTAAELNATLVLKGAHSLIGYSDKRVFINLSGNPGMSTAGSGDVLTGTIAAMFGLGLSINDAVRMGVFVHGLAGDLASGEIGEDGLVAGDIMACLPKAVKTCREKLGATAEDCYHSIYVI
jgi:hydroxyethylthiazole kinase-like uncharacterized protein yjeF